jgi:hypothetical protein
MNYFVPYDDIMKNERTNRNFFSEKSNYTILLIGSNCSWFHLMSGGGSDDPAVFSDAIFNFRRIFALAPTTVLIGFGITIYAILKSPKK